MTARTERPGHLLEVDDLHVEFITRRGVAQAVRGVSLHVDAGETVGLVGESGSGKSVTSTAILGMVELPGRIVSGDVRWRGESMVNGPGAARRAAAVRGKEISVVFQDPMTSLNPLFTVGAQIAEVLRFHLGMSRRDASNRAVELLDLVGIPNPRARARQHPHEFSGGMRQRALIAMALACEPKLLIADEPTTALDVTIQAQILELLTELQAALGLAVLLITHDLGVVAGLCHRVEVMYAGRLVERASTRDLFGTPQHPYSAGLLASTPRLDERLARLVAIDGVPPDPRAPAPGCAFEPRCSISGHRCTEEDPELVTFAAGRAVACWERAAGGGADRD
ncbi:MAG TPA: ABC transporter ATP-binding protein [Acidimicrobiales bacterium]|nr:ABC transporter ATP-binding protein [Acidimicrobiales bacterium]